MRRKTDIYEAALREDERRLWQQTWLEEIIERLSGSPILKCGEYWNRDGVQGYYACYQMSDRYGYPLYIMISRSHTNKSMRLEEIIEDLRSSNIAIPFEKFGEYPSRARVAKGGAHIDAGTYATIKFGKRWYMISKSGRYRPQQHFQLREKLQPVRMSVPLTFAQLKEMQYAARVKTKPQ